MKLWYAYVENIFYTMIKIAYFEIIFLSVKICAQLMNFAPVGYPPPPPLQPALLPPPPPLLQNVYSNDYGLQHPARRFGHNYRTAGYYSGSSSSEECDSCSCNECYRIKSCCRSVCDNCNSVLVVPYPMPYVLHELASEGSAERTITTAKSTTSASTTTTTQVTTEKVTTTAQTTATTAQTTTTTTPTTTTTTPTTTTTAQTTTTTTPTTTTQSEKTPKPETEEVTTPDDIYPEDTTTDDIDNEDTTIDDIYAEDTTANGIDTESKTMSTFPPYFPSKLKNPLNCKQNMACIPKKTQNNIVQRKFAPNRFARKSFKKNTRRKIVKAKPRQTHKMFNRAGHKAQQVSNYKSNYYLMSTRRRPGRPRVMPPLKIRPTKAFVPARKFISENDFYGYEY